MINLNSKIYIAGHTGLIGSAILRRLKELKYKNLIYKNRNQLDLKNQLKVYNFLKRNKPDAVIIAAALVGGIKANNQYKADFIFDNLSIQNNLIHGSYISGVKNLIFLGSSCVYPKNSKIPIKEKYLLSGFLEETNEPYAIAKIAGIKLCSSYNYQYRVNYKSLMPCNSYGKNDNYNLQTSHLIPALIKKIYKAKKNNKKRIEIWGNGKPLREVIYSDDIADACIFFLKKRTKETLINIGTGTDKSIKDYAKIIMKKFDIKLKISYKNRKLNGTFRKLLDVSLAKKYGWRSKISFSKGIIYAINDFLKKYNNTNSK